MTDRDAFIQSILANPADDTPRLVFADWLGENGEPERAEFIRVQCALSRLDQFTAMPHWREREQKLFDRRKCEWFGDRWAILTTDRDDVCNYTNLTTAVVRRGFVDEIRQPLAAFLEHAEELFRNHPITRVVLTDVQPAFVISVLPEIGSAYERHVDPGEERDDHELPDEIWSRLPLGDFANPRRRWYRTRERADDCLSDACVYYGRELAGLPAL